MSKVLDWLLEEDVENPGVRFYTLTDLLGYPVEHPDVTAARQAVMNEGPVPAILGAQETEGYWEKPGEGYYPKYRGTVWSVIYLAQLGADPAHPRSGQRATMCWTIHGQRPACSASPARLREISNAWPETWAQRCWTWDSDRTSGWCRPWT